MLNNNNYITLNKFPLKSPQATEELLFYYFLPIPYSIISINITKYTLLAFLAMSNKIIFFFIKRNSQEDIYYNVRLRRLTNMEFSESHEK